MSLAVDAGQVLPHRGLIADVQLGVEFTRAGRRSSQQDYQRQQRNWQVHRHASFPSRYQFACPGGEPRPRVLPCHARAPPIAMPGAAVQRLVAILNPQADRGRTAARADSLRAALAGRFELELKQTSTRGEAISLARE